MSIELANGHFAHETELADGQTEHADKQIEHAEKQIEHAEKRIERDGNKKSTHPAKQPDDRLYGPLLFVNKQADKNAPADADWPDNLISTIRNVMDIPCPTPAAPEFIFELSDDVAAHNQGILSKHEFSLEKALDAKKAHLLVTVPNSDIQTSYENFSDSIHYGHEWKQSSQVEADGH